MAAFDVFKTTLENYPNQFATLVGMMRDYAGIGDLKNALKYTQLALLQAPDQQNRTYKGNHIKKLKEGKDIN